jgi:hypothetical protein
MVTCSRDGTPDNTFTVLIELLNFADNTTPDFPGPNRGGGERQGIIEFDLSSQDDTVTSAALLLEAFLLNNPNPEFLPFDVDVFVYSGDGLLTLEDWNQGDLATTFTYDGEEFVTIDLTASVNQFIQAGIEVLGINLRLVGIEPFEERGRSVAFFTEDTPNEGDPPFLFLNEPPTEPPQTVEIDIKPKNDKNLINICSSGSVRVAILGSNTFDPRDVDRTTVIFAGAGVRKQGNKPLRGQLQDVDGDRISDLVLKFNSAELKLRTSSKQAALTGETTSGDKFAGVDSVVVKQLMCVRTAN